MMKYRPLAAVILAVLLPLLILNSAQAYDKKDMERLLKTRKCPGCAFKGLFLFQVSLEGVDLSGADLTEANVSATDMRKANLSGAILRNAFLTATDLRDANLQGADLRGADLKYAKIKGVNWTGVNLEKAIWINGRRCRKGSIGSCKLPE